MTKEEIIQTLGPYEDADKTAEADRLTHRRMNGIRTGYWSARGKAELQQQLEHYEGGQR